MTAVYGSLAKCMKRLISPKFTNFMKNGFSDKYLFYTNVGISVTLSGLGDALQQHYEIINDNLEHWDSHRTRNMAVSGMTVGMVCHHWYKFLDRRLPGVAFATIFKKIIVDQVVCSPLYVSVMFVTVGVMERQPAKEIVREIKQKFLTLYAAEWIVWPGAQFVNFYFVSPRFRVLYDNTVSLGYDIFTSHVKHKPVVEDSL